MKPRPLAAAEGHLSWIERWSPSDAEIWARWRRSLTRRQRAEALLPLQATLSGLAAFRHLENHPHGGPSGDFRPHLHAVRVSYRWALRLIDELRLDRVSARAIRPAVTSPGEPSASLEALRRSLTDALLITERLIDLPLVDAGVFQSSCDLFLRDLGRNSFFHPPEPLEFSNVAELLSPQRVRTVVGSLERDASETATLVAFLALLRDHRFLGIADRQMAEHGGIYRAHVVLAGARRELRTLMRFFVVQGMHDLADELRARLLRLDAHHVGDSLPEPSEHRGQALPAERMRNELRELREAVKGAAKRLRDAQGAERESPTRVSERVRRDLSQDIWAFRFILQAFLAKASAATSDEAAQLGFASEFARHFRAFGLRLIKGTGYERRGPLMTAVGGLSRRDALDAQKLAFAYRECDRFLDHLDRALASTEASFDKGEAAVALRDYLAEARSRAQGSRAPTGAFGSTEDHHAEAG